MAELGRITPKKIPADQAIRGDHDFQVSLDDRPTLQKMSAPKAKSGQKERPEKQEAAPAKKSKNRTRAELAFLPAALEIIETPPSPAGRWMAFTICGLFLIAALWAYFGHIDEVAIAQGKVQYNDRVKVVQSLDKGVIRQIHVDDGVTVRKGDPLIELDPTQSEADATQLAARLADRQLEIARLKASLLDPDAGEPNFVPPADSDADKVGIHRQLMFSQLQRYRARRAGFASEIRQQEAELARIRADIRHVTRRVSVLQADVKTQRDLVAKKLQARRTLTEPEIALNKEQQTLSDYRARIPEIEAAIERARSRDAETKAGFLSDRLAELTQAQQDADGLRQELVKARRQQVMQRLTAPVDGVVQELAVHTVGGVVEPAKTLMKIVPQQGALEIEALVENKDIGFITPGQKAEVKVETFQFTRFGTIDGEVMVISRDARELENVGLVYPIRVAIEAKSMTVEGEHVDLRSGMRVTVEVKTGTRRILDFILSPLLRYRDESLRER